MTSVSHRINVTVYYTLQMQILETTGGLRELSRTKVQKGYLRIVMSAYQLQSIDLRVLLNILSDVSVRQPRGDNAEWEQRLRNPEEG